MKSMRLSLLCAAVALISACSSTPIPPMAMSPIISAPPAAPASLPKPPPEPTPPPAEVFAISMPGASPGNSNSGNSGISGNTSNSGADTRTADERALPSNAPIRMSLLLPLRSETLGAAAESLRAGFLAGWERDRDNITVTVVETGDAAQDILASYALALERDDIIVGPLARSAVTAVAASPLVAKPTIALNYPDGHGTSGAVPLPAKMLAMGLSIEEEARQVAQWAAAEHPETGTSAMILSTDSAWQRRIAAAFAAQWQRLGRPVRMVELGAPNSYLSDPGLVQLRARLRDDPPGLLFSAMGADQTRQLRGALSGAMISEPAHPILSTAEGLPGDDPTTAAAAGTAGAPASAPSFSNLPLYGTSALNPGISINFPTRELDGVRLLDLPWQVQRDHPAVMVYPQPLQAGSADMQRLYALGIDAYRVAREIARQPSGRFHLDGVTGRLTVDFGEGPARFERLEQPAVYLNGVPKAIAP